MGNEVTIKIAAQADPSLTQIPAQVKQNLEKAFQGVGAVPQDINQKFVSALKSIEVESARASSVVVAELKQISSGIASFQNQVAQSHGAMANSLNQMASAGAGVGKVKDQIKEGTSEALQAAEGVRLFTETMVRFFVGSVTHGVELTKELDEVRDRLDNITHSTTKTQEIMRSVNASSLNIGSFNLTGLRTASVQLALFHQDSKKHLKETADLAAYAGKSIEQTATTFGRAMEGQKKAFNTLMNQYDIGPGELAMFGVALDKNGKLMLDTSANIDKARNALEKWIQTYAEGASKPSSLEGNIQAAKNAVQLLQEELAKPMLPVLQDLTLGIREASNYLFKLPDGIKSTVAVLANLSGGIALATVAFIGLAGPINQAIILCGTLSKTIPALAKTMTWLGTTLAIAAPYATAFFAVLGAGEWVIEDMKRKAAELSDEMQRQSKVMAGVKVGWEQYVKLVNEAGKGKGPDLSPSNAPPSQKIKEINEKLQTISPSDTLEALRKGGISEEQLKKANENYKEGVKTTTGELDLLRRSEKFDFSAEAKKKMTPQKWAEQLKDFNQNKAMLGNDAINLGGMTEDERKQWKELTKDAKSYAEVLQIINTKQDEFSKYRRSSEITGRILDKTSVASSAAEKVKDITDSADAAIKYSEKFKNPEGEKGNMAGDMQRLELLKNTEKKIAEEIKSTFGMESVATETVLKKLETTHDTFMRAMLEKYLDYANKVEDTQKSIVQGEIKNFDDALTAKKQNIQTSMELDKMSQDQKVAAEKKILKELKDITAPENKREQNYEAGGKKHTFIGADGTSKYTGEGPETELDYQRKLYQTSKGYRDNVNKEKAAIEKNVMSDTKKAESDHLKDLDTEYENYLSSRREATKNDIQAQINDLNYFSARYQEDADKHNITDEMAAKKKADILKKTTDLAIKLNEKERDAKISSMGAVERGLTQQMDVLEEKMTNGENTAPKIEGLARKRLQVELALIEEEKQKRIEMEGAVAGKREEIELEAQQKRLDIVRREQSYIQGILQKAKSDAQDVQYLMTPERHGGFNIMSAFGESTGKGNPEIPSFSASSNWIDVDKKNSQTLTEALATPSYESLRPDQMIANLGISIKDVLLPATDSLAKAFDSLADRLPAGFSAKNYSGMTPDQARQSVVSQAIQNQSNASNTTNSTYIVGGQGVTPPADVQAKWDDATKAILNMKRNTVMDTFGGYFSF